LGCESDLRDEEKGLPALGHCFVDRPQINLCFAAARDPVEEKGMEFLGSDGLADSLNSLFLIFHQQGRGAIDPIVEPFRGGLAVSFLADYFYIFIILKSR
jgi:hypothetical protein